MSIKTLPVSEQPREKLLNNGVHALADSELLAILFRHGDARQDVVTLSHAVISHFGGLREIYEADRECFLAVRGLGLAKYVQFQAAVELAKRIDKQGLQERDVVQSSAAAKRYVAAELRPYRREVFACMFLNAQHHLISFEHLFQGTIDRAPVYPRELVKRAMLLDASAVILAHNHPSGVEQPSAADKAITQKIADAMDLIDVRVLDHFIVAERQVFSFAENGLI